MGSSPFAPDPVNWRWLLNIARTRGLPAPAAGALQAAVIGLEADVDAQLRQTAAAVCGGTETPEQLEWLAAWLREVAARAVDQPPEPRSTPQQSAQKAPASYSQEHPLLWAHTVFGASAALAIEVAHVEGDAAGRGAFSTVRLEFAKAAGKGKYGWDRKETFRLDKGELYALAALIYGDLSHLEFAGHGARHNKVLTVADQGDKLYFSFKQGGAALGVPITSSDVTEFGARVLHAAQQNLRGIGDYNMRALVRRAAQLELFKHDPGR